MKMEHNFWGDHMLAHECIIGPTFHMYWTLTCGRFGGEQMEPLDVGPLVCSTRTTTTPTLVNYHTL